MSAYAGRVLNGRYRLIRTVGVGSQASVWVGEHLALTTQVAVKLIDPDLAKRPDARERFKREATAAATLRSPHVVQILDHGIDGDQPFIVMELLEGEDLFQRLEKRHHLSIKDTSKIVTQIARALTRAHAAGVVHRDLKPENIFLAHNDDDEIVKVLDFGVAKVRDAAKVTMQKTGVGTLIGTPHYMSPEQVKGIGEVDFRTDLWAMGVLGYQCVTGELPFESEGVGDLLIKITIGEMPVPSKVLLGVPPAFDAWFARACDRDAARRFASARAAAEALARIAGLLTSTAGPTTVPRPSASIPPPGDPTKRQSDLPPPPPSPRRSAKAAPPPARPSKPPVAPPVAPSRASELDDDEWQVAEPIVSVAPPAGPAAEDYAQAVPPAPRAAAATRSEGSRGGRHLPSSSGDDVDLIDDVDEAPPPSPRGSPGGLAPVPPSRAGATPAPVSADGPLNPFLINDFVAPPAPASSPAAVAPQASPSSSAAIPPPHSAQAHVAQAQVPPAGAIPPPRVSQSAAVPERPPAPQYNYPPPPSSVPRSTVSGVDSSDVDDDDELQFGKNRRTKMVRWLMVALLLAAAGITWMVVSSQFRAGDPEPAAPPPASSPSALPSAVDPIPTATTTSTASATPTASVKLTGKLRPVSPPSTNVTPVQRPKKPGDGSVEIPTPGDDPGLPPPAP